MGRQIACLGPTIWKSSNYEGSFLINSLKTEQVEALENVAEEKCVHSRIVFFVLPGHASPLLFYDLSLSGSFLLRTVFSITQSTFPMSSFEKTSYQQWFVDLQTVRSQMRSRPKKVPESYCNWLLWPGRWSFFLKDRTVLSTPFAVISFANSSLSRILNVTHTGSVRSHLCMMSCM